MKILLKGYYGFGNLGDDILMLVSYKLLRELYPHAEIVVFSNNSAQNPDAKYPPGYNRYIRTLLNEEVEIIDWTYEGHFDLIFHGGGGVYFDNSNQGIAFVNKAIEKTPIPWLTKIDSLLRKASNKSQNLSCSKRIGAGIGIGKYDKKSPLLFKHLSEIGSYDKLIVRDSYSYNFVHSRKFDVDKLEKNTDLAFLNSWNKVGWRKRQKITFVGIVIKGKLDVNLIKCLIQLHEELTNKGFNTSFFSFDKNYDISSFNHFYRFNLKHYSPKKLDDYLNILSQQDVLFTTRAHGAILGACLGIPSIIVNLEPKMHEVADMLNESSVRIDDWNVTHLIKAFDKVNNNYSITLDNLLIDFRRNNNLARQIELVQN